MPIKNNREYRFAVEPLTVDSSDENKLLLRGTPIVFEKPTLLFEMDGIKYYEKISRGALTDADTTDFIFNYNHTGRVYARSKNGSLKLTANDDNANVDIELDANDAGHQELYRDIKSGRIDKMSFAFSVAEQSFNRDTHTRSVVKIKKLFDVSAVDFPAYADTDISARGLFEEESRKEIELLERQEALKRAIAYTYTF